MKMLARAALWLSAFVACAPLEAAPKVRVNSDRYGPAVTANALGYGAIDGDFTAVDAANPLPSQAVTVAATSTPFTTAITAMGSYGPFVPQLGRTIWVTLTGTWSGAVQVGTTTTGNCADAVPLTVGGQTWANFTANANEPVGEETRAGAGWCLIVDAGFAGTLNPRLGQ